MNKPLLTIAAAVLALTAAAAPIPAGIELSPADGSAVESVQQFTITFSGAKDAEISESADETMISATFDGQTIASPSSADFFGNPMTFSFPQKHEAAGKYTVTFDAGYFLITEPDNSTRLSEKIVYTLEIVSNAPAFTCDPASGSQVESIQYMEINFQGVTKLKLSDSDDTESLVCTRNGIPFELPNSGWRSNPVVFGYRTPVTQPGVYSFNFAKGMFQLTLEDGSVVDSPAINYVLQIGDSGETPDATSFMGYFNGGFPSLYAPLNLGQSDGIQEVFVALTAPLSVNTACTENVRLLKDDVLFKEIPANCNPNRDSEYVEISSYGGGFSQSVAAYFHFGYEPITADGKYQVVIPDGFFLAPDKSPLTGGTLDYSIGFGSFQPGVNSTVDLSAVDADSQVVVNHQLAAIRLTTYYPQVVLNPDGHSPAILYSREDTGETDSYTGLPKYDDTEIGQFNPSTAELRYDGATLVFDLSAGCNTPINKNGIYMLSIPTDFFALRSGSEASGYRYTALYAGDENPQPYEMQFTVVNAGTSSVDGLAPEPADPAAVYTPTGLRISPDPASLPAGLYIIGGRKVIVK